MVSLIATSRQAVVAAPESAAAWGRLGQAFHAVEFFPEARQCYARAATLDPQSPRWPHLLGLLQLQDQPDEALANLERAVVLSGGRWDAPRLRLAQALVERGREDAAAGHLAALLAAQPGHAAARVEQARLQLARGQLDEAAGALSPCLTNAYTARPALLLMSQIQQRRGDGAGASQLARRAAGMPRPFDWPDPFLREVQVLRLDRQKMEDQINGLLMQRRLPEAGVRLNDLLQAYPQSPEGWLLLGRLRYQEQKCAEAEAAFRRHLEVQPQSLNGLVQLGLALLCQQRWADAAGVLRQAVALKPDFAQAHYNLGYALFRSGDAAGAAAAYREALRSNPGEAGTHLALAEVLVRLGQGGEAARHLDRAAALAPNDPRIARLREQLR
ncbi:MAG: repeat-containing protein YrrB [Verrucomicrobiota bacterium]|jgi:tetratricopeptide (TPR) repeat protein